MRRPWWQWVIIGVLLAALFWLLFLAPQGSVSWWPYLLWSAVWFAFFALVGPHTRLQWFALVLGCVLITAGAVLGFPRALLWVYLAVLGIGAALEWLARRRASARS